jgi:hypothetical protein
MNRIPRIQDGASRPAVTLRGSSWAHPRGHDPRGALIDELLTAEERLLFGAAAPER